MINLEKEEDGSISQNSSTLQPESSIDFRSTTSNKKNIASRRLAKEKKGKLSSSSSQTSMELDATHGLDGKKIKIEKEDRKSIKIEKTDGKTIKIESEDGKKFKIEQGTALLATSSLDMPLIGEKMDLEATSAMESEEEPPRKRAKQEIKRRRV